MSMHRRKYIFTGMFLLENKQVVCPLKHAYAALWCSLEVTTTCRSTESFHLGKPTSEACASFSFEPRGLRPQIEVQRRTARGSTWRRNATARSPRGPGCPHPRLRWSKFEHSGSCPRCSPSEAASCRNNPCDLSRRFSSEWPPAVHSYRLCWSPVLVHVTLDSLFVVSFNWISFKRRWLLSGEQVAPPVVSDG